MNLTYLSRNAKVPAINWSGYILSCPVTTYLTCGGCDHRNLNDAGSDIAINYAGPNLGSPTTMYQCNAYNAGLSSRAMKVWAICASASSVTAP